MLDKPYVIQHRRPYRCIIVLFLTVAVTAAATLYWSQQWQQELTTQLNTLQQNHDVLVQKNENLTTENHSLNTILENINQSQAMQQATDSRLQSDIQALQDKVIELNKELLFYQNITQGSTSSELQVRELHLRPTPDNPSVFFYRIVLTQGKKITKSIKGSVELVLNMTVKEKAISRVVKTHDMKIRHVQILEGVFNLEANEHPVSAHIRIKQGNKVIAERNFEWDNALSPEF